jgi:hypothetical protein
MVGPTDHPALPRPNCSFHRMYGQKKPAQWEGMTTEGVPAYMCDDCLQEFGIGLTPDLVTRLSDMLEGILE